MIMKANSNMCAPSLNPKQGSSEAFQVVQLQRIRNQDRESGIVKPQKIWPYQNQISYGSGSGNMLQELLGELSS